jgi:hypothetical protein
MGKLPADSVRAPRPIDDPFIPLTKRPDPVAAPPTLSSIPTEAAPESRNEAFGDQGDQLSNSISARFTAEQWAWIQTECYSRRMRGQSMSIAQLLRLLVDERRSPK